MPIWDQNQGAHGGSESAEAYDRFVQYLEMGAGRSLTALAKVLGVSRQTINQAAARYDWRARASAWDQSRGVTKRAPAQNGPSKAPPAPAAPPPPPPPPPASTAQAVDPEVLGLGLSNDLAETHLQALSRYRQVYDAIGYGMAMQAYSLFPLVQSLQSELGASIELRGRLRAQMQIPEATMMAATIKDLIPQYAKLCEAMHSLANGGRTHWGDAIGVHRILEEAYSLKKGQP